jgi:hypothetical protein
MKRLVIAITGLMLFGCGRPAVEDCRKAVANMQKLRGLDDAQTAPDPEAAVRRCRSTAKPATVQCLIQAKTAAELDACETAAK